jgi:CMP-N-acetylneuraminic acid synthetase
MRHSSERVLGKNYRKFGDKPLFHHIIETLLNCDAVDQIVIDTDSPIITNEVTQHFPTVKLIDRPLHLRDGATPMNDVLLYDTEQFESNFYLQTHSTNPLLQPETIKNAIDLFLKNYPVYDSLFGVTRQQTRYWDQLTLPINHNPGILLRTQDLPAVYEENSNIYIFTRDILRRKHNRIGDRPLMFEIDRLEAWDIDEETDFLIAEFLYLNHRQNKDK